MTATLPLKFRQRETLFSDRTDKGEIPLARSSVGTAKDANIFAFAVDIPSMRRCVWLKHQSQRLQLP